MDAINKFRAPKNSTLLSPPLSSFPDTEHARTALESGFDYGRPEGAYLTGETQRTSLEDPRGHSLVSFAEEVNKSPISKGTKETGEEYTKAALAVNRSPIAALGFSPDKITTTPKLNTKEAVVGGAFNKKIDSGFAKDSVSLAHETIHRGLGMMKEKVPGFFKGENEEVLVHYLMYRDMGDPNKGRGDASDNFRKHAIYKFEQGNRSGEFQRALKELETEAQRIIAARRPGGHR